MSKGGEKILGHTQRTRSPVKMGPAGENVAGSPEIAAGGVDVEAIRLEAESRGRAAAQAETAAAVESARAAAIQAEAEDVDALLAADVARIEAERREPLPEGSEWEAWGGDEIEPLLAFLDVIDAAWLLKLANGEVMPERKGVVPAWQDVPPEAKLSLSTLRKTTMTLKLPIAVLSYGWAARGHGDPTGALLRRLKPVLERMAHCCEHGYAPQVPDWRPAAWGIVWDFMSLPQRGYTSGYNSKHDDRTPYQLARFGGGFPRRGSYPGLAFAPLLASALS